MAPFRHNAERILGRHACASTTLLLHALSVFADRGGQGSWYARAEAGYGQEIQGKNRTSHPDSSNNGANPGWKSILVKTGPDRYREIYHDEPNEGKVMPSFLRQLGGETVLGAFDNQYRMEAAEEFWCFSMGVPIRLNFEPLWQAATKATPAGQYTLTGPLARSVLPDSVSVTTFENCNMPHCSIGGAVRVKFKMQQCSLMAVSSEFEPKE